MNGRALADIKDASGADHAVDAGQLLDGFAQLRDDGTTTSGCWIFSGSYTEKGNQMARRDASDPREAGIAPNWAWAWPANRRILYNRASADPPASRGTRRKPIIEWNGSQMGRPRRAGLCADRRAVRRRRSVHHERRRRRAPVCPRPDGGGAVPRALRAVRIALSENVLHPEGAQQSGGARLRRRPGSFGDRRRLPLCRDHLSPHRAFPLSGPSTR